MTAPRAMLFVVGLGSLAACAAAGPPARRAPGYLDVVLTHELDGRHAISAMRFELDGRTVCRERHEPPVALAAGSGTWIFSGELPRGAHVVSADLELRVGADATPVRLSGRTRVLVESSSTVEAITTASPRVGLRIVARPGRSRIVANVPCSVMQGAQ